MILCQHDSPAVLSVSNQFAVQYKHQKADLQVDVAERHSVDLLHACVQANETLQQLTCLMLECRLSRLFNS